MLYLLLYLIIGYPVCVWFAIDELIQAKRNNLDWKDYLDWLNELGEESKGSRAWEFWTFVFGLTIWPARIFEWIMERPARFEAYIAECEKEES